VDILSIDKDLWQLVTNPIDQGARIEMLEPITMTQVTHELVEETWGIPPVQLADVLVLAGDAADNIPGVPGIGPKITAKLISEFGSPDELLARSDEVPQTKRRKKLQLHAEHRPSYLKAWSDWNTRFLWIV
jgi:DNA polymerase-1